MYMYRDTTDVFVAHVLHRLQNLEAELRSTEALALELDGRNQENTQTVAQLAAFVAK